MFAEMLTQTGKPILSTIEFRTIDMTECYLTASFLKSFPCAPYISVRKNDG